MRSRIEALALAALAALAVLLAPLVAQAAPEAHILRVDPRAAQDAGNPILTTVVEVVQPKRVSDAVGHCAGMTGNVQFDCMAQALERPYALYTPFPFPKDNAIFTVNLGAAEGDRPGKFVSSAKWGESLEQPGVGTAWVILIDADKRIGNAFADAKQVADRFVASMGSNDIVNVMFINDRQVVKDSRWMSAADRARASSFINSVPGVFPSSGRNRSLFTIIKTAATDAFKALGNVGEDVKVPLHQAMVVLSTGYGGADAATTGPGALQLQQYLTGGRFPEDNTALPKAPLPVISVLLPASTYDEYKQNALDFMQNLADTSIGGFFTVVQAGQGGRGQGIVNAVRTRFSHMHIVKWRVSCIAPSITQSFRLVFNNVKPPILGDNTFKDVPVGIDPSTWPLDVNVQYSQDMAKRPDGVVYPGGRFKVYGDFCWGGEKSRAEVYFVPAGQPVPAKLSGNNIDEAKRTQQQLIAQGMKGQAIEANDTVVEFQAPDKEKILHGSGEQAVVRIVVYDNKARRTTGVTADSIVQLKGSAAPLPWLAILGGALGLVVLALLVVIMLRGGGKRRGPATPPPAAVSPMGYGAPPGPYGAPPGPSPMAPQAPPPQQPMYQPPPQQPMYQPPPQPYAAAPAPAAAPPPTALPQPATQLPGGTNLASPALNQEFMYGGQQPAQFGVAAQQPPQAPPPDPYAQPSGPVSRATLQGAAGVFTVVPGVEIKAGRDGAQCRILLSEPRVSGVHTTLKIENGQLLVRDEHSNNGTLVNGTRVNPGVWMPVQNGSLVRFGPVEFSTRLE